MTWDQMIGRAMLIYNEVPWAFGKQDLDRNRAELAEALVGEDLEKERT